MGADRNLTVVMSSKRFAGTDVILLLVRFLRDDKKVESKTRDREKSEGGSKQRGEAVDSGKQP